LAEAIKVIIPFLNNAALSFFFFEQKRIDDARIVQCPEWMPVNVFDQILEKCNLIILREITEENEHSLSAKSIKTEK
jgi:hypothetical protein